MVSVKFEPEVVRVSGIIEQLRQAEQHWILDVLGTVRQAFCASAPRAGGHRAGPRLCNSGVSLPRFLQNLSLTGAGCSMHPCSTSANPITCCDTVFARAFSLQAPSFMMRCRVVDVNAAIPYHMQRWWPWQSAQMVERTTHSCALPTLLKGSLSSSHQTVLRARLATSSLLSPCTPLWHKKCATRSAKR